MTVELQKAVWKTGKGNLPCWWGGTMVVEDGDEVFYYESPTVIFFHGIAGKEVHIPMLTRHADG